MVFSSLGSKANQVMIHIRGDDFYGFEACQIALTALDEIGVIVHDCDTCINKLTSRKIAPCIDCAEYELWSVGE